MCRYLRFLPVRRLEEGTGDRHRLLIAQAPREGHLTAEGQQAHPLIHQDPQVLVQLVGGVLVVDLITDISHALAIHPAWVTLLRA